MNQGTPTFENKDEEAEYFKNLAMEYKKKWKETQQELEEFQESSRELEAELEAQLEQSENQIKDLRSNNSRLTIDSENLKEKVEKLQYEREKQVSDLQEELTDAKAARDEYHRYIRELEQANDDLERAKRATVSSLEDFEGRLNQAIERNAFLENELDEKESLAIMVQRLKDEARDLRQELLIKDTQTKDTPSNLLPLDNDKKAEKLTEMDSNKFTTEIETQTGSPLKSLNSSFSNGSNIPLTPSARISALNIVGDLLRKVGALESKLASCRNFVKDAPQKGDEKLSPISSPSRGTLTKSQSLASPKEFIHIAAAQF